MIIKNGKKVATIRCNGGNVSKVMCNGKKYFPDDVPEDPYLRVTNIGNKAAYFLITNVEEFNLNSAYFYNYGKLIEAGQTININTFFDSSHATTVFENNNWVNCYIYYIEWDATYRLRKGGKMPSNLPAEYDFQIPIPSISWEFQNVLYKENGINKEAGSKIILAGVYYHYLGINGAVSRSTNGIDWEPTLRVEPSANGSWFYDIASNGSGYLIVTGQNSKGSSIMYASTTAGNNWNSINTIGNSITRSICYGAGKFVGVNKNGQIAYSTDGSNWINALNINISQDWYIAYGNGTFVLVGNTTAKRVYRSTDGINWTLITTLTLTSGSIASVNYCNNMFTICGSNRDIFLSGNNGQTWTKWNIPNNNYWYGIYNGTYNLSILSADNGIMTSFNINDVNSYVDSTGGTQTGVQFYGILYSPDGKYRVIDNNGRVGVGTANL